MAQVADLALAIQACFCLFLILHMCLPPVNINGSQILFHHCDPTDSVVWPIVAAGENLAQCAHHALVAIALHEDRIDQFCLCWDVPDQIMQLRYLLPPLLSRIHSIDSQPLIMNPQLVTVLIKLSRLRLFQKHSSTIAKLINREQGINNLEHVPV